jgi:hypothetical protein
MSSIAISVNTVLQSEEKEKRAEIVIANSELHFKMKKRRAELHTANKELSNQAENFRFNRGT